MYTKLIYCMADCIHIAICCTRSFRVSNWVFIENEPLADNMMKPIKIHVIVVGVCMYVCRHHTTL